MRLLRHEHNTTFRVDAKGATFVLRINRSGVHGAETIASELAWLRALTSDTELGVPEPVAAGDGSPLVIIEASSVGATPRPAVLLRWQGGRIVDARLTPRHLRQIATLQAGLQQHSTRWARPDGFVRPAVDTLTSPAKKASIGSSAPNVGPRPSHDDAEGAIALVDELLSTAEAAIIAEALDIVWASTDSLQAMPESHGLIHADLHYENVLFHHGVARAIDFDDCGWGFYLYDLAVTLWELEERDHYPELRDALLDEFSRHLPLPVDHGRHVQALIILRKMQILMWFLESRQHVAFRDNWRRWSQEEVADITAAMQRFR